MGWGDDVMVTGQARVMQQTDPRPVRVLYERANRWPEVYDHNPRIVRPDALGDFQILHPRVDYLRPYTAEKGRMQWRWKAYQPPVGELYFSPDELAFGARHAGRVIIEPHIKGGASPNKQWGWVRWNKLAWLLGQRGIRVTQLGPPGTPLLENAEFIATSSLRLAAAVLAQAQAAVLPEGGLHHTAAVFGIPAVVIYGGFISPEVTGYAGQHALFVKDDKHPLGCGMRVDCPHCKAAMGSIKPEAVATALETLIEHQAMAGSVAA